jgi:hypothetical protein
VSRVVRRAASAKVPSQACAWKIGSRERGSKQGARAGGRESHGVGRGRAESEWALAVVWWPSSLSRLSSLDEDQARVWWECLSVELGRPVPGERVYECGAGPAWAGRAGDSNGIVDGESNQGKSLIAPVQNLLIH